MTGRIRQIFNRALESLKIGTLMGSFYPRQKMYELKTCRGVMCHDNEVWCEISRGINLLFQKLTWEIWQILTRALGSLNNCTLVGSFWAKYIIFEIKKYKGVTFHDTEKWCKIWKKLFFGLENGRRNLANFNYSTGKSQNWDFDGILLPKTENVSLKFTEELSVMTMK